MGLMGAVLTLFQVENMREYDNGQTGTLENVAIFIRFDSNYDIY